MVVLFCLALWLSFLMMVRPGLVLSYLVLSYLSCLALYSLEFGSSLMFCLDLGFASHISALEGIFVHPLAFSGRVGSGLVCFSLVLYSLLSSCPVMSCLAWRCVV